MVKSDIIPLSSDLLPHIKECNIFRADVKLLTDS